jgi:mannose-1-phosphate guanylyltransferase / phosphomannomutase
MKAVIMAGGEGTRLRPLTCDLPKPMARLCGRPVIEHIVDLLGRNGVDEAAVTLRYLPELIKNNFPDGEYCGVSLRFIEEDEPLGTAGGVVRAASGFNDDFIVVSGDAMCDFNLKAAMDFHHEKGAAATLVLSRVADPREYGLVVTDPSGAVKGFVEKPGWAQAVTDAVNTGIYIISKDVLSLIPSGQPYDFAKDLFPLMLGRGMKVFGFEAEGYWCDIGDIGAYTSCQCDMLDGLVGCDFADPSQNGIYHKGQVPSGNFSVMPPVYIGEGVRIGDFSVIGPFAVIDDDCTVGVGATIKNSVILPGTYVGDHCELRGALVCAGASLKRRAGMYEGSVAGAGSIIGADASVSPGVRIWPGKTVEDGARAAANIKTGCAHHGIFDDEGITGEVGADVTPESCACIGAAAGSVFDEGRIGVGCDGSVAGANLKNAATAGILSAGAEVCDFGSGFESLFNFAVRFFGLDMGIFVRMSGNRAVIKLLEAGGLGVGRGAERKIESAVSSGDIRRCGANEYREPFLMPGIKAFYQREMLKNAPKGFDTPVMVKSPNREIQKLLSQVLRDCGCHETANAADGAIRVHIDASGEHASFFCEDGTFLNPAQTLVIGCIAAFENGEDVSLPYDAPNVIDTIADNYGRHVLHYLDCPADKSDAEERRLAAKQTWVRDGIENSLRVMSYARTRGKTLAELKSGLPEFAVSVKAVSCTVNPGLLLRRLAAGIPPQPSEGVVLSRSNGRVFVSPLKRGTGLRIIAEACNMEAAGELCADIERELRDGTKTIDNEEKRS